MWVYSKDGRSFLFKDATAWGIKDNGLFWVLGTRKCKLATFRVSELLGWHFNDCRVLTYTPQDKLEVPDV